MKTKELGALSFFMIFPPCIFVPVSFFALSAKFYAYAKKAGQTKRFCVSCLRDVFLTRTKKASSA